jgi:hypothetical protein
MTTRKSIILFCAIGVTLLGCSSESGFNGVTLCFDETHPDLLRDDTQKGRWILQATRFIPLPATASKVFLCEAATRDTTYYLVFQCDYDDLKQFVRKVAECEIEELPSKDDGEVAKWFTNLKGVPARMRPILAQAQQLRKCRYHADRIGRRMIVDEMANRVFLFRM